MNYALLHCHTMLSNGTTNIDSVTNYEQYINKAKELGMKAIAFTEHGNIFQWIKKKECCEKNKLKYIHGVECYITATLEEKTRDNYHTCLYARNWEGVKEINKLITNANNREDGHFYYVPRITMEEFLNISDNILISSACLGSVLSKCEDENIKKKYLNYFIRNKNRCFLEIQHHLVEDQIEYNKYLYTLHNQFNIPLIAATDTHALDKRHLKGRSVLQKSKKIYFENEEGWDLSFKTYDELIELYKKQNSIPMEDIYEALQNTNRLVDMVEEFELDRSYKYPQLYNDSINVFQNKIKNGIISREIYKKDNYNEYEKRINHEYKTIAKNGSVDFFLLEEDLKSWCRENRIQYGYSRGSVSGSEIAYLLYITEIDSIKHKMNFERFMNLERVSLADVDTDYSPEDRERVKDYLFNKKGLYCSEIITFNTIALKGAIRDVARALEMPLSEVNEICESVESNEKMYRDKYPELFEYVDILQGVIVSVGSHPCGFIVSPISLDENIGLFTTSTSKYPISQINMKEIDSLNFVKLDILGLDNIQIINDTCKLANIERLTPDNINENDEKVWESIKDDNLAIFQWESNYAHDYYKKLFSKETIEKIKTQNSNFSHIDLFSIGNGAIRPAGESYRESLANGEYRDNGHKALNDFLAPTLGYLVYQEQIIEFLHSFCGFTMGQADIVRRGFAKKTGTEQYMPKIKEGFYKTMKEKYDVSQKESEQIITSFIKVIEDASDYLFSENHAKPYSYIGYACAWLRYYYPLEFLTVILNINKGNEEKTSKSINYAESKNIKILPPKFRYAKAEYMFDKEQNAIYKGVESIKFLNEQVANELYELRNNKYNDFIDLLKDISNTSINSKQLEILIRLGYFSEFGKTKRLLNAVSLYNSFNNKKQIKKDKIQELSELNITEDIIRKHSNKETEKIFKDIDTDSLIKEVYNTLPDDGIFIGETIKAEVEYLGYAQTINASIPLDYAIVSKIEKNSYGTPFVTLYRINDGESETLKINKKFLADKPIDQYDMIKTITIEEKHKKRKIDGKWIKLDETEKILGEYAKVVFD